MQTKCDNMIGCNSNSVVHDISLHLNGSIMGVFNHSKVCNHYSDVIMNTMGHDGVSNRQPHDCLLNRLFRRRSKKTQKFRVTGLCVGNSPGTGEFPAQMASNAENVSIWWRHRVFGSLFKTESSYRSHKTSQCVYVLSVSENDTMEYTRSKSQQTTKNQKQCI